MFAKIKNLTLPGIFLVFMVIALSTPAEAQTSGGPAEYLRSFDRLFPAINEKYRAEVFSETGLIHSIGKNGSLELIPSPSSGIDIHRTVLAKNHSYLSESLLVVPYSGKIPDKLDAYNALGKISDLKGRLYRSHSKNSEVPLFEEATRLEGAKRTGAIPDPAPASVLPAGETVYIRLKDVNFGNSYYKADFSAGEYGVIYNLTNFKNLTYLFITVMKEERFSAILYLEPLAEGMLVYSVAGADASDFIANRIDIPSAISKRLAVFIGWVTDGIANIK